MDVYPLRLIPQTNYSPKVLFEQILTVVSVTHLQRGCDIPFEQCCCDNDPDEVLPAAFGEYVHEMSVNLLGTEFKLEDIMWCQKGAKQWKGEAVVLDSIEGLIEIRPHKHAIYMRGDKLHRSVFSFPAEIDPKLHKDFTAAIDAAFKGPIRSSSNIENTQNDSVVKLISTVTVEHVPMNLNYWHFQITANVQKKVGNVIIKNDKGWRKEARHYFLTTLLRLSTLREPKNIQSIDKRIFIAS